MRKNGKRLVSLILALMVPLCLGLPALADDPAPTEIAGWEALATSTYEITEGDALPTFPEKLIGYDADNAPQEVPVTWDNPDGTYDNTVPGGYTFTAALDAAFVLATDAPAAPDITLTVKAATGDGDAPAGDEPIAITSFAAPMALLTWDLTTLGQLVIPAGSSDDYNVSMTGGYTGADPMIAVGANYTGNLTIQDFTIAGTDNVLLETDTGFAGAILLRNVSFTGSAACSGGIGFADGANGTLTLDNASIDVSANYSGVAALLMGGGTVSNVTSRLGVVLADGTSNSLISGGERAGLEVTAGGQLNISGTGALHAECKDPYDGEGAGIGEGGTTPGGNVVIESGTITAVGGYHGAGIGGSYARTYYNGNITILGGHITSTGGGHGAGIGGGCGNVNGNPPAGALTGVVLVLPPAVVVATTTGARAPLVGAMGNAVYIGDPGTPKVTIRTSENTPNAPIYMDVSGVAAIVSALAQAGSTADPARIFLGNTGADGILTTNMEVNDPVRFFTTVLSSDGQAFSADSVTVLADTEVVLSTPNPIATDPTPGDGAPIGLLAGGAGLLLVACLALWQLRRRASASR